jgi:hypothetical protein
VRFAPRGRLREFGPRDLSSTAWALAAAGHDDAPFVSSLLAESGRRLGAVPGQELSSLSWAAASLGCTRESDPEFLGALVEVVPSCAHLLNAHSLSNLLWALATLGHRDAGFMAALLERAERVLPQFSAQALSNTAWALATLEHRDHAFMTRLLAEASTRLHEFAPQVRRGWFGGQWSILHSPLDDDGVHDGVHI